MSKRRCRWW